MTFPPTAPPESEALALESGAVADIVGPLSAALSAALAVAGAAVAADVSAAAAVAIGRAVAHRLRALSWPDMSGRLPGHVVRAVSYGRRTAGPEVVLPPPVLDALPDLDSTARDKIDEAADIADATPVRTQRDLDMIAGRARTGVARASGAVRYAVNDGINSGTADVARAMGERLLWVAERNACLHCLAYAGWSTEPDQAFPHGLTYDPRGPLKAFGTLLWPPLHPSCRCRVRRYKGPAGPPPSNRSLADPAARLAAEARRSVVYQWTDYSSSAGAERAAAALLNAGAGLADSVEKRARALLRRGGHRAGRPSGHRR